MNSLYDFIVKPLKSRYNNTKTIAQKEVIINSSIENFKAISKEAVVVSVPLLIDQPIKVGDTISIHHNIFRRWYDVKGKERNSRSYFKEDLYFCSLDQVYLYKNKNQWKSFLDRCFIKPTGIHQQGIVKFGNKLLEDKNIFEGDIIYFKPEREFEFSLNDEILYCMKSKDIVIKYGRKENQTEYNSSRSTSGERIDKSSEGTDCRYRGGCDCGPTKERSCHQEVSDF